MAKDGTNRGGARIGAGQKKKPLADKILEGNPGTVFKYRSTLVTILLSDITAHPPKMLPFSLL
jgi:hypothetical protein